MSYQNAYDIQGAKNILQQHAENSIYFSTLHCVSNLFKYVRIMS